ncbi:FAD:protein FMN transferase [Tropicimonas marinistellae]|uniref:FAD:protein FMN transferase n=1 Tax=Tropicimonas marinistellae TaxID=1739787 RepID=UPI00082E8D1B|nr:FAD:protein FMN transferase [Tropicimonas marinistellae]
MTPAPIRGPWLAPAAVLLCLSIGLASVFLPRRGPVVHSETLFVFGTLVEVVIYGETPDRAKAATAALDRAFRRYHQDWHAWRPGELGRLNAAIARGESQVVSPELAALLRRGQALSTASGGLFEPAIGRLIALWGFHDDTLPTGPLPDPAAIDRLVQATPRIADLRFDGNLVRSLNPAVQLDLGGYAKGAALDLAADALARAGIHDAVLNAGGDLNVLGTRGAREWRVAIRDPYGWGAVAALNVHPGEVVYTSGNYERFLEQDGARYSHILDPRTGWPVQEIVSATVLDTDGARADAAATALSVAGRDAWMDVARAMGVKMALLIDADGRLLATPAMAERLEATSPAQSDGRAALPTTTVALSGAPAWN